MDVSTRSVAAVARSRPSPSDSIGSAQVRGDALRSVQACGAPDALGPENGPSPDAGEGPLRSCRWARRWSMTDHAASNGCSPSTTRWHFEDSLRRAPARMGTAGPPGPSIWALRSRDPRKSLDLQIRWQGGAEALYEITARGWKWTFPGDLSVHDVLRWINRQDAQPPASSKRC